MGGYPFDDNTFNLRRLQAKTKVHTDVLDELLYADDMDKNASSEAAKNHGPSLKRSRDNYDLTNSTKRQRLYTKWNTLQLTNYHGEFTKTEKC